MEYIHESEMQLKFGNTDFANYYRLTLKCTSKGKYPSGIGGPNDHADPGHGPEFEVTEFRFTASEFKNDVVMDAATFWAFFGEAANALFDSAVMSACQLAEFYS